ncbi:hypothetical protein ACH4GM_37655 [Streptomyces coeruleorubidus]|uniref:hypothetical protein n=1 Tax=Streptomyces coeruleorubidus TaxID=116188 RepID=UPI0037A59D8C
MTPNSPPRSPRAIAPSSSSPTRPTTIRRADRIAVLEAGRITEQSTWNDLTARPDSALNRVLTPAGGA